MPKSGGSIPQSRGSGAGRTGGSSYHSSVHGHHRGSASPTEFYRARHQNAQMIEDKLMDMNSFIYKGIDKFLDKQAVRDLIQEYEDEDLYGEGGLDGEHFLKGLDSDSEDEVEVTKIEQEKDKAVNEINKIFGKNGGGNTRSRARPNLLDTFVGLIKVKLFNVHRRTGGRDVEGMAIFSDHNDTVVSCFG